VYPLWGYLSFGWLDQLKKKRGREKRKNKDKRKNSQLFKKKATTFAAKNSFFAFFLFIIAYDMLD
jgi:hypothetical protein